MQLPILADTTKEISSRYGVLLERAGIALRGLFIINPQGVIQQVGGCCVRGGWGLTVDFWALEFGCWGGRLGVGVGFAGTLFELGRGSFGWRCCNGNQLVGLVTQAVMPAHAQPAC